MAKQYIRIQGLLGVRDLIKAVCEQHQAKLCFRSGVSMLADSSEDITYPLAFLESDFRSSTEGPKEIFQINLEISDYLPKDATEEEVLLGLSKTDQILSEIHHVLKEQFHNVTIGELSKLPFRDNDDDNLVTTRGEFTLTAAKMTARDNNGTVDLPTIPSFGEIAPKADSEMSDISNNAVQNKVVKAYIDTEVDIKADTEHSHIEFTQLQASLGTKADTEHTHPDFDAIQDALATKSDTGHSHNDKYYTQSEVDNKITAVITNVDWVGSVESFAEITTTYPNPLQGWTLTVNSEQVDYRYSGTEWVNIGNNAVPMSTSNVDGRMSKEHYTIVENLSSTHYTRIETNTSFAKKSELNNKVGHEGSPIAINKMWLGNQFQYDAIVTKDANTIYFIQG